MGFIFFRRFWLQSDGKHLVVEYVMRPLVMVVYNL